MTNSRGERDKKRTTPQGWIRDVECYNHILARNAFSRDL